MYGKVWDPQLFPIKRESHWENWSVQNWQHHSVIASSINTSKKNYSEQYNFYLVRYSSIEGGSHPAAFLVFHAILSKLKKMGEYKYKVSFRVIYIYGSSTPTTNKKNDRSIGETKKIWEYFQVLPQFLKSNSVPLI